MDEIISVQVVNMITQHQIQLLRLQQNNQIAAVMAMILYRRLRQRRRRQYWLRPWILRRPQFGYYENSMAERESHGNLRMEPVTFHELVQRLKPHWNLLATGRRLVADRSPISRRIISDQSPINRRTVADQTRNSRRLIADRSQQGCLISEPKCWWNQSATDRWLVGDCSATSKTIATSLRSESVAASLLCMFKRLAATNFVRRPISDLVATIIKLHCDFCNLSAIVIFLVAERSRRGRKLCGTGA